MKIAISGSGGYIAGNLIPALEKDGHTIFRIARQDLTDIEKLTTTLSDIDAVIHLAGSPILKRWTTKNKAEILKSRVESTSAISTAILQIDPEKRPKLLITASAIGIYEPNKIHTETSEQFAHDFVSDVVKSWEKASENLPVETRRVVFRIGLVIGSGAKTIESLKPVFHFGLGGKVGSGKQPFPFIHITDAVNAIIWAINDKSAKGIYNLVAPENIDNNTFTRTLAKQLKRPALFSVPAFLLKIALGEASSLLLSSPQAYPERLIAEGFSFTYPTLQSGLDEII